MNSLDVVIFGEAMAMFVAQDVGDLSQVHDFTRRGGGRTQCCKWFGAVGIQSWVVSRVGSDSFGRFTQFD